ncbi:hypothetical protein [Dyadobacter sp. CY312]|uniref:hypothetical protein n=1 Tax=Dyadobacter sp. CY312 TaxID=2907303 RepID=UPI001F19F5D0|nr:hypothetical protein [Dyadobacter sp. CY312]MCE7044553.1 hypothetical protein [Dyadobacter sp. CY312]
MNNKYTVVTYKSVPGLIDGVNKYMVDGWIPTGGVSTKFYREILLHMQAMYKL